MKTNIKSTLLLLMTAMIWGFAFVAQLESADKIGSFTFNGLRFLLGSLSLIPVILIFDRAKLSKSDWIRHIKCGIIGGTILFSAASLQQIGIVITNSAGKSGFITGLYTVLVPIIGFIFLKRKNSINIWLGSVFAVIGLFMLCMLGSPTNSSGEMSENAGKIVEFIHRNSSSPEMYETVGIILMLIGSVLWAVHIIFVDSVINGLRPLRYSSVQFAVCGTLSIIVMLFTEFGGFAVLGGQIESSIIPICYGGFLSVGVAYTCQTIGQKNADPTFAAILMSTESVFSAVGEMLFYAVILGQSDYVGMGAWGYVGSAVIFAGIVVSQLDFNKKILQPKPRN